MAIVSQNLYPIEIKPIETSPLLAKARENIDLSMQILSDDECFSLGHNYFLARWPGTRRQMFLRAHVVALLREALKTLPPGYKFHIYDGYRSFETQEAALSIYLENIMREEKIGREEAYKKTLTFVALPSRERMDDIPHLSGGAVDLCLTYHGTPVDMGSDFDEASERSHTVFFEGAWQAEHGISEKRWLGIQHNRRLLYHCLRRVGFTNFSSEWWHYDFGNRSWATILQTSPLFGSAETLVAELEKNK